MLWNARLAEISVRIFPLLKYVRDESKNQSLRVQVHNVMHISYDIACVATVLIASELKNGNKKPGQVIGFLLR